MLRVDSLHAYMLTRLHAYVLHACAYMLVPISCALQHSHAMLRQDKPLYGNVLCTDPATRSVGC